MTIMTVKNGPKNPVEKREKTIIFIYIIIYINIINKMLIFYRFQIRAQNDCHNCHNCHDEKKNRKKWHLGDPLFRTFVYNYNGGLREAIHSGT